MLKVNGSLSASYITVTYRNTFLRIFWLLNSVELSNKINNIFGISYDDKVFMNHKIEFSLVYELPVIYVGMLILRLKLYIIMKT